MKQVLRAVGFALLGLIVVLFLWGLIEPYLLDVERQKASIPGLPATWEGRTVAQISDFQVGMWLDNEPTVRRAIQEVIEERPDLVLVTGDFIYKPDQPADELEAVAALMRPLAASDIPVYAVLGNHDYGVANRTNSHIDEAMAQAVTDTLEGLGIDVLRNEAVVLASPSARATTDAEPLYLVGVGPYWPNRADEQEALQDVPEAAPRLVMMHNPRTFGTMPAETAPFTVAGHTHGGQVRVPFLPHWSWIHWFRPGKVHADGWAVGTYGRPGNALYVNRGIGMGGVPIRINCRPEVTYFVLQPASGEAPAMAGAAMPEVGNWALEVREPVAP